MGSSFYGRRPLVVWSIPFFRQREMRDGGGYGRQGQCYEVMYDFEHMQSEMLSLDAIIFICTLKACRRTETTQIGQPIHDRINVGGYCIWYHLRG